MVGIESGTLVRHLVQIIPVLLALGLVIQRPEIGSAAAVAVFALWTLIMVLIWLYCWAFPR